MDFSAQMHYRPDYINKNINQHGCRNNVCYKLQMEQQRTSLYWWLSLYRINHLHLIKLPQGPQEYPRHHSIVRRLQYILIVHFSYTRAVIHINWEEWVVSVNEWDANQPLSLSCY
ncbi:hypothetical protein XELAEV_18041525mg [Xenopus laevis]|uniref:Uncharacterized protein n=1 Tax=Xenopus laevis TaxID=8355 RepID=A0A974C312_XENLA|nr:hypothetical protein XELAEV_18041525mg [Xenopus laevis]